MSSIPVSIIIHYRFNCPGKSGSNFVSLGLTHWSARGRSNTSNTSSVRLSTLLVNACTTSSHRLAFSTSNRLHCHESAPPKLAAVVSNPSPLGRPMDHAEVNRSTSPTFSPPAPSLVHTASPFSGATSSPKGSEYLTTTGSEGPSITDSKAICACTSESDGGMSSTSSNLAIDNGAFDRGRNAVAWAMDAPGANAFAEQSSVATMIAVAMDLILLVASVYRNGAIKFRPMWH
mmetsp:Transcript_8668/g.25986  ORF Transcript_8668/g.25986 Transcript_8668/m.25986 type:complete len:232 (-) Transcript_8668:123-818(-)